MKRMMLVFAVSAMGLIMASCATTDDDGCCAPKRPCCNEKAACCACCERPCCQGKTDARRPGQPPCDRPEAKDCHGKPGAPRKP